MLKTALGARRRGAARCPAAAQAHVTLQPNTAPAGGFTRLDVRVPNERDDASTDEGRGPVPRRLRLRVLRARPGLDGQGHQGEARQADPDRRRRDHRGRRTITWTADSEEDAIPPGAFQDFGLSVQIPGKAGDKLTFKALQTYTGGEVVRWIGAEGSDNPAPIVTVTGGRRERARARPVARHARRPTSRQRHARDRGADRRRARPDRRRCGAHPPPARRSGSSPSGRSSMTITSRKP